MDDNRDREVPTIAAMMLDPDTELLDNIFRRDDDALLDAWLRVFSKYVDAEIFSIYLCDPSSDNHDSGSDLRMHCGACYSTKGIEINPNDLYEPLGQFGLLDDAFNKNQSMRVSGDQAINVKEADGIASISTVNECRSLMVVPIHGVKNEPVGVVEIANKTDGDGNVIEFGEGFDEVDLAAAETLARDISLQMQGVHIYELYKNHLPELGRSKTSQELYDTTLRTAVRLLDADYGQLLLCDASVLNVKSQYPLVNDSTSVPVIAGDVWRSGKGKINSDETNDGGSQSEIAVCWEFDDGRVGVLSAGSRKANHFRDFEITLLSIYLHRASVELEFFGRSLVGAVYQNLLEETPGQTETLKTILETARDIYGFGSCLLYLPDESREKLYCAEWVGCSRKDFKWRLSETSLATQVFNKREIVFVQDAAKDAERKGVPNKRGLEAFGIKGAIMGVPLIYRGTCMGVLVVWHSQRPDYVKSVHRETLEPFAKLAAAHLGVTETVKRHENAQRGFLLLQQQLQKESHMERNLRAVMEAVANAGFDRVRVCDYHRLDGAFECRMCIGANDAVLGQIVTTDKNPYARHTAENGLDEPVARVYDPRDDQRGPDPDAARLGKPEDLPWAVVPLVIGGVMYGQIVADNAVSRREIRKDVLNYLTLLGALAAQSIAVERQINENDAKMLPLLYDRLHLEERTTLIYRRLLIYATCREVDGLRFTRALFFEYKHRESQFECVEVVGSMSENRHQRVTHEADFRGLRALLDDADSLIDDDLRNAVSGLVVNIGDLHVAPLFDEKRVEVRRFDASNSDVWSGIIKEIGNRIDSDSFLIASVCDRQDVLGLMVVDRKWLQVLGHDDEVQLRKFAEQAARVLRQRSLHQQVLAGRDLFTLGFIAKGLAHDLRQPIGVLERDTGTFIEAEQQGNKQRASDCMERIKESSDHLIRTVRALESFLRPEGNYARTDLRDLFENVITLCGKRAQNHGVEFNVEVADEIMEEELIPGLIIQAIVNLIANAQSAVEDANIDDGRIDLRARNEDPYLIIEVSDNGPGIPEDILANVDREGSVYSGHPSKGLGFGLQIVRNAAKAHHGHLMLENNKSGRGACARMYLRLKHSKG